MEEVLRACVVVDRRQAAADVIALDLVANDGTPLPPWTAGAHIDVLLPSGRYRQYSLCGDPADLSRYTVAVLKEPRGRGGSVELHERVSVGSPIEIRGPRNHFTLDDAPAYVFVAGGIGITPLLPMIAAAQARSANWTLLYGGRSLSAMAFQDRVRDYPAERVTLWPQDIMGLPDLAAPLAGAAPDTQIYCCGPEGLLRAARDNCVALGLDANFHFERFSASPPNAMSAPLGAEFSATLSRIGLKVHVPADRSLLDSVLDVRPQTAFGCRKGYCGACETRVLAGEVDHRDEVLSDTERASNQTMLLCVSRARSDSLVLDL